MTSTVTIIVPVYNAVEDTIECIESILESDAKECPILIMDDGSWSEFSNRLQSVFGDKANVRIITHFQNRGYTKNIQFGLSLIKTEYVLILNSDCVVPRQWLQKLLSVVESAPCVAGVGPLSNAASYQSVPRIKGPDGSFSLNENIDGSPESLVKLNRWLEYTANGHSEDLPILNGFCTLFRVEALRSVGGYDTERFRQGYGEENDLAIRLLAAGYRLRVACDTFVYHKKSKSFGDERKRALSKQGRETLNALYGAETLEAIEGTMRDNALLHNVRSVVDIWLGSQGRSEFAVSLDENVGFECQETGAVVVGGPAHVIINERELTATAGDDAECGFTVVEPTSLEVRLCSGSQLAVLPGSPLQSALAALAILSHSRSITFGMSARSLAPQAINNLQFGRLFAA